VLLRRLAGALPMPCHVLLAEWGTGPGKKPLYRKDPALDALSPSTQLTRISGTDHAEVLWHPTTVQAIEALLGT
jgi:hypothetical protein